MATDNYNNQLEFPFMENKIRGVESLDYIGGQDENLGGCCEPLIIQYLDGMEEYVLHEMYQSRETYIDKHRILQFGDIINNYKKAVFSSEDELMDAWRDIWTYLNLKQHLWEETNSVCGCNATFEEFYKTKRIQRKYAEDGVA